MKKYEIVKFEQNGLVLDVNVSPAEDTVWLSLNEMCILYGRDKSVISRHIRNIFKEGELDEKQTVAKNATVQNEGGKIVRRNIDYYNLDMIISVGYRVKSQNGIIFRRWANSILKKYLLKGYTINEDRLALYDSNINELKTSIKQIDDRLTNLEEKIINKDIKEIIFFNGEYFDARSFLKELFSKAKVSITLIDAYADNKALDYLKNKNKGVFINLYISSNSKITQDDIDSFNKQYGGLTVNISDTFHDRFIIIDESLLYHLGTSLNYAGKKTFAVTKMEDKNILDLIKQRCADRIQTP